MATPAAPVPPAALAGVRVVEMGQLIAGPFAGKMLGEFGAEVIKIEPPGSGDPLRKWRMLKDGTSVWWQVQSRNKRSIALDLRAADGQELARRLIAEADVLIENFRPGTLEGWGLGWDELRKLNAGLVMLRISGYGQTGPYRDQPGFGVIGEAMGGLRHLTGEPGRVPVRVGVSIGDTLAGLHGVIGVMMALYHRKVNGGVGQVIDVALHEAVFNVMESLIPEYSVFGAVREPTGSSMPGIAPTNAYRCSDGFALIAGNGDSIFRRLMEAIGRHRSLDLDPQRGRRAGSDGGRPRAGRQGLHSKGHLRGPALPRAPDDRAPGDPRRLGARRARRGAEALRHPRQPALAGTAAWRGHRFGAAGTRPRPGDDRRAARQGRARLIRPAGCAAPQAPAAQAATSSRAAR